jgi:hypothetical protein
VKGGFAVVGVLDLRNLRLERAGHQQSHGSTLQAMMAEVCEMLFREEVVEPESEVEAEEAAEGARNRFDNISTFVLILQRNWRKVPSWALKITCVEWMVLGGIEEVWVKLARTGKSQSGSMSYSDG